MSIPKSKNNGYLKVTRNQYNLMNKQAWRWKYIEQFNVIPVPPEYTSVAQYLDALMKKAGWA